MKKKLIVLLIAIILLSSFFIVISNKEKKLLLKCYGNASTLREDGNHIESKLNIRTSIFLYNNGQGILAQVGSLNINNNNYIIDRTHKIYYSDDDNDGIYTMEINNLIKREGDTLTDDISIPYNLLGEKSAHLYVSITKPVDGLYLFKESNIPLFLCKKL